MQLFQGPISVQANKTVQPVNAVQYHTITAVPCGAPAVMEAHHAPNLNSLPLNIGQKPGPPAAGPAPPIFLLHANFVKSATSQDRKPKSILSTEQGSKFGSFRPDHNDIPDLLSGFDMHAASLLEQKTKDAAANLLPVHPKQPSSYNAAAHADTLEHPLLVGPIGESPYITSKSFDDLHQCLATNQIPHLDLNEGHSTQQKEQQKMVIPTPSSVAASGIPIQVSTNNCPGTFVPYANQQSYSQPMPTATVSFMPQLHTQMMGQFIPAQEFKTVVAVPTMVPKSEYDLKEVLPPRKSFGSLSSYKQNRNQSVIAHTLPPNPPILNDAGAGALNKRDHNDAGLSFHSLLNDGCTKRFKSSHAVSTTSEPSSSDGELVPSSYENSSASSKAASKQSSNLSDSSETD